MKNQKVTVTFEDRGQDFLEFDIEDGKVVGCRPFQADIWCGMVVLNKSLKVGDKIKTKVKHGGRDMEIMYPIIKVVVHPKPTQKTKREILRKLTRRIRKGVV